MHENYVRIRSLLMQVYVAIADLLCYVSQYVMLIYVRLQICLSGCVFWVFIRGVFGFYLSKFRLVSVFETGFFVKIVVIGFCLSWFYVNLSRVY